MESPSKMLLGLEAARAVYEYGLGWLLHMPLQYISPKGDGHPVIVFPGLGGADGSTHFIRNFLENLGYEVYSWGLGRNLGPREGIDILLEKVSERVAEVSAAHDGQKVSLIGWSLGGIYAREAAKMLPEQSRQVITLGTPFKAGSEGTNARILYEILTKDKNHDNPEIIEKLKGKPPVPFTSIYSKSDGVVSWQCSIEDEGPTSQNIEVPGASHLGLGHNPITMHIIADRLSQNVEDWKHYKTKK